MSTAPYIHINHVHHPKEWDYAWACLLDYWKGDHSDYNARYGECWQYMGTEQHQGQWQHLFRHRMHPKTNNREYHRFTASPAFQHANPILNPIPAA